MKKFLSLALAIIMVFSVMPMAFASDVTPVIVVSGMGSYPLFSKESGNQVYGPDTKTIVSLVAKQIPATVKFLADRDWKSFAQAVAPAVFEDIFEIISCNEEGVPNHELYTKTFPKSLDNYPDEWAADERYADEEAVICAMKDAVGAENTYFFNYDWRLDPYKHASDLNDFIENVKKEKNSDKVILIPCSMGGVVTTTYLSEYGSGDVEKIIYAMTAFQGMDMVGELFTMNMDINVDTLTEYLFSFSKDQLLGQILAASLLVVTENVPEIGNFLDSFIKEGLVEINDILYKEVIRNSFASFVGFWSFVPEEYYEKAKDMTLGDGVNKNFEAKIDKYHYNVQNKAKEILDAAKLNGTAVVLLSSYGYMGSPVASSAYEQSDCLIETYREAGGAAVAKFGETLGDESYKAKGSVCSDSSHNHVSTDCIVDASTGMYPENTWYFKFNKHVGIDYKTECSDFLSWAVTTKGQISVFDNEKYPQFMHFDNVTGKLTSLTGSEIKPDKLDGKTTLLTRLIIIIKTLYSNIIKLVKGTEK